MCIQLFNTIGLWYNTLDVPFPVKIRIQVKGVMSHVQWAYSGKEVAKYSFPFDLQVQASRNSVVQQCK